MEQLTKYIMLLSIILGVFAANNCHGTDQTSHLYPVKGQPFQLPLSSFFSGTGLTYSTQDANFHVQQTVVRGEPLKFFSQDVNSVLKIAQHNQNYAILTQTETGFAVYESSEGQKYLQVGDEITINGLVCNAVSYIFENEILVSCLEHSPEETTTSDNLTTDQEIPHNNQTKPNQSKFLEINDLVEVSSESVNDSVDSVFSEESEESLITDNSLTSEEESDESLASLSTDNSTSSESLFSESSESSESDCVDSSSESECDESSSITESESDLSHTHHQIFYIYRVDQDFNQLPYSVKVPVLVGSNLQQSSKVQVLQQEGQAHLYVSYVNPHGEYERCSHQELSALYHWTVTKHKSGEELYTFTLAEKVTLPINDVLVDYHVTSDRQYFLLFESKGLFFNDFHIHIGCFVNGFESLGVFEEQQYENQQSYQLAVSGSKKVLTVSFNPYNDAQHIYQQIQVEQSYRLSANDAAPQALSLSSQSTLSLNEQFVVYSTPQKNLLFPGIKSQAKSRSFLFAQNSATPAATTFNQLTNEVIFANVNEQLVAYLSEPFLHANLNGSEQQGNFTVTSTDSLGANCTLSFNWTLIDDPNNETKVFTTRSSEQIQNSSVFKTVFPVPKAESLSDLFYGPDLKYTAFIDQNDVNGNQVHVQQWVNLTNFPHANDALNNLTTTFTFGKNFINSFQEHSFFQFIQTQLNTTEFLLTGYNCSASGNTCHQIDNLTLNEQITEFDVGYNSFQNISYFAFLSGGIIHINQIAADCINHTLATLNLSLFLDAPFAKINNFKIIKNELYIVTQDPATVQVICLSNFTAPTKLYELSGIGYQPHRVYSHGPFAYLDNTFELQVIQTFGHEFMHITSIPYGTVVGGQSVAVGITNDGIYIAITTSDLSISTIQFTPRNQILAQESQYILPLHNHTLTYPVQVAATNDLFYILSTDAILVYQNAPSSYDMLYTTLPTNSQNKMFSAVRQTLFDAILVVGDKQTINKGLQSEATAVFTPSFPPNGLNTSGQIHVGASKGEVHVGFNQSYLVVNQDMNIKPSPVINTTLKSFSPNLNMNPSNYFSGSVINYNATCQNHCTQVDIQNCVHRPNQTNSPQNPQAVTMDEDGNSYLQTVDSLYLFKYNNYLKLAVFDPLDGVASCNVMFFDDESSNVVSLCNTQNNTVISFAFDLVSRNYSKLTIANLTNVKGGDYLEGVLILTTQTSIVQYLFSLENGTQIYEPFATQPITQNDKVSVITMNITTDKFVYAVCILKDNLMNVIYYTVQQHPINNTTSNQTIPVHNNTLPTNQTTPVNNNTQPTNHSHPTNETLPVNTTNSTVPQTNQTTNNATLPANNTHPTNETVPINNTTLPTNETVPVNNGTLPTPPNNQTNNGTLPVPPTNETVPVPPTNETVPVNNATIPVNNATVPVQNETVPVNNATVPVNNTTVPVNNATAPVQNETIPVNNATVPVQNETLPVNNATVPVNNATVPVNNETVPVNNATVPVNNATVPVNNETVPVNNATVPVNNATVPVQNETVPVNNATVPVQNETVPVNNATVPVNNATVPINNETVPVNNATVPVNNATVPVNNATVPVQNETVPVNNSTVPVQNETLPVNNATVPVNNATVPVNNATVPVQNETVPVNNATVPVQNETVPVNNATVPVNNTTVPVNNTTDPVNNQTVPMPPTNQTTPVYPVDCNTTNPPNTTNHTVNNQTHPIEDVVSEEEEEEEEAEDELSEEEEDEVVRRVLVAEEAASKIKVTSYSVQLDIRDILAQHYPAGKSQVLQILQIGEAQQIGSGYQVPLLAVCSKMHYQMDLKFRPHQITGQYNCPYAGYGDYEAMPNAQAIKSNRSVVVPFQGPHHNNVTIGVYGNHNNCNHSHPITIVGGYEFEIQQAPLLQFSEASNPMFKLFETGQLFTQDPNTQQAVMFETSSEIKLNLKTDSNDVKSTVLVTGSNYLSSQMVSLEVDIMSPHIEQTGKSLSWLWVSFLFVFLFASCGAGIYFLSKKKKLRKTGQLLEIA